MAKSKWPQVQEKLPLIEKWSRDGLTEEQICKNLGISRNTLNDYKNRYPDIMNTLKRGKAVSIAAVENALHKRALGFEYIEIKTYIKEDGEKVITYTEKTTKYIPPDVGACAIVLKNRDKENWMDNPQKVDIDKKLFELKERIVDRQDF
jgi:transcriptional regulator with XRE-family HTH domain